MFTFSGHRQSFLLLVALLCLSLPGCAKKKESSQAKGASKPEATSPKRDILKQPEAGDVEELMQMLSGEDESTKQNAANALALLKSDAEKSVPELMSLLNDDSPNVRASAANALAAIGDEAVVSSLSDAAIKEEDKSARNDMWTALGLLGATSALANSDMNEDDRTAAIAGLKKNGGDESVATAIDQWLSSEDADVRKAGLALFAENSATNTNAAKVVDLLRDEDGAVRQQALEALKSSKLSDDLQADALINQLLMAKTEEDKQTVQQQFDADAQGTTSVMLKLIGDPQTPADVRNSALVLLSNQPDGLVAKNLDELNKLKLPEDADTKNSELLAKILLKAGGKPSQQSLLQLAVSADTGAKLRSEALGLLEPDEDSGVAEKLAAALKQVDTKEPSQQALALSLLSAIEGQGANGASVAAVVGKVAADGNSELNQAVLKTLLAINPAAPETTSALKSALTEDDSALRDTALAALDNAEVAQLQELAPELATHLADSSAEQSSAILGLLQKAGPKALTHAAPAITDSFANAKTSEERKSLLGLMSQMDSSKADVSKNLVPALADEDPEVVANAMKLLSKASPEQIASIAPQLGSAIGTGPAKQSAQLMSLLQKSGPKAIDAAAPAIAAKLKTSPEAIEQDQLLNLLAGTDTPPDSFVDVLAQIAGSDDPDMQKQAISLLEKASPTALQSVAPELGKQFGNSSGEQMAPLLGLLNKAGAKSVESAAQELTNRLKKSSDPADRKQVLELLSQMELPADQQKESALAAMSDEDADIRAKALAMLTKPGNTSPEVIQQLIASADDESPAIRKQAIQALAAAGKNAADAKPLFSKILEDKSDPDSRRQALAALSKMASGEESKALLETALSDSELRSESAKLITRNPVDGVAVVADAMQSKDSDTAQFASDLLTKMSGSKAGRKGLTALAKNSDQHRGLALMNLGAVPKGVSSKAAANALLPFIRQEDSAADAWKLMNGLGDDALPTLSEIVSDDQIAPEAKKRALKMIAGSDNVEIAGPILESLIADDNSELGTDAALAMAMLDPTSASAANRIASELSNPDSTFDSQKLVKQLKAMKTDPSAAMRSLLNAPGATEATRKAALNHLLAESPISEETTAALVKATAQDSSEVSLAAAIKLAESGSESPEVAQRLIDELSGENATPAAGVLKAISAMGPSAANSAAALAELAKRDPANVEVLKTIASLGENAGPALDAVRSALESEDPEIRKMALETLIASKDSSPATMESLQQIEDPELKIQVSEVVSELKQQLAQAAPAMSSTAAAYQIDSASGQLTASSACAENSCQPCINHACETNANCSPVQSCQPVTCQPAVCQPRASCVTACQPKARRKRNQKCVPVCETPKAARIVCPTVKVKVKTVSCRKYQKIQARNTRRSRR